MQALQGYLHTQYGFFHLPQVDQTVLLSCVPRSSPSNSARRSPGPTVIQRPRPFAQAGLLDQVGDSLLAGATVCLQGPYVNSVADLNAHG